MYNSGRIFAQVYDLKKKDWLTVCPITAVLNEREGGRNDSPVLYTIAHQEALADYLRENDTLYVISAIQSRKHSTYEDSYFVLQDISMHLRIPSIRTLNDGEPPVLAPLKKFMKAKNSCVLTPYVDKLCKTFGDYNPLFPIDKETFILFSDYERLTETLDRKVIPETE